MTVRLPIEPSGDTGVSAAAIKIWEDGMLLVAQLNDEQKNALRRHGYEPAFPARGITGAPGSNYRGAYGVPLRPRVCFLDGIEVDGHVASDLDSCGCCIHCDYECSQCAPSTER